MRLPDNIFSRFFNHRIIWRRESLGIITVETYRRENKIVIKRDNKTLSGVYIATHEPTSTLYWFPHLTELFPSVPRRVLSLGGGACVYPAYAVERNSNLTVDVVEIDPVVVEAARLFFPLPENSRFRLITGDGIAFLRQVKRHEYDFIFVDVGIKYTNTDRPYNMQFINRRMLDRYVYVLEKNGTLMINIMTTTSPQDMRRISRVLRPFSDLFKTHMAFRVTEHAGPMQLQDIVHVLSRQSVSTESLRRTLSSIPAHTLSYPKERYTQMLDSRLVTG